MTVYLKPRFLPYLLRACNINRWPSVSGSFMKYQLTCTAAMS